MGSETAKVSETSVPQPSEEIHQNNNIIDGEDENIPLNIPEPPPPPPGAPQPPAHLNMRVREPDSVAIRSARNLIEGRNLSLEETANAIFKLDEVQPAQQAQNGQQPAAGIHAPANLNMPGKATSTKVAEGFDTANKVVGHALNLAGVVSGMEKATIADPKGAHKTGSDIFTTSVGGVKAVSSLYSMSRQAHNARKASGRNRIAHRQSTVNAVSSGIKALGGLFQAGSGGAKLGNDKKTANGLNIVSSSLGLIGSGLDMISSSAAAVRYKNIANKYGEDKHQAVEDKAVNEAAGMAGFYAKQKHKQNSIAAGFSAFNVLGAMAGLGGSILGAVGLRSLSGIFGMGAGLLNETGKIFSDFSGKGNKLDARDERRDYVDKYLNKQGSEIVQKAAQGDPDRNIPGIAITLDDAKRIALKKIGMFTGNTVTSQPLNLDEKTKDMIYNGLAMKRADDLANSKSKDKKNMLKDLGLAENATRDEIAAMLGYTK